MSDQTTEPSVVEGAHLQKIPKRRRISTVSFVGVMEVGPFVGGSTRHTPRRGRASPGCSACHSRLRTGTVRLQPASDFVAPETLGFESSPEGWWKTVGERRLFFMRLRSRPDLEKTERLQRSVFGVSDRDLASSSILVAVHETGGEVLGAFDGGQLVGFVSGWGGYLDGRARLVSDLMAVESGYRGGIGFALKGLQAIIAFQAGFEEIVWTVDPLRAVNARLNFERLGAHSRKYLRNLYGEHFAEGLYGGLPSDRLFLTWPLRSARVRSRLLGRYQPLEPGALAALPEYDSSTSESRVRLAIPGDFDGLLSSDPARAREWRYRLRDNLEAAFASGYVITGFAGRRGEPYGYYVLERDFVFE